MLDVRLLDLAADKFRSCPLEIDKINARRY
jgi:hypothetical protein